MCSTGIVCVICHSTASESIRALLQDQQCRCVPVLQLLPPVLSCSTAATARWGWAGLRVSWGVQGCTSSIPSGSVWPISSCLCVCCSCLLSASEGSISSCMSLLDNWPGIPGMFPAPAVLSCLCWTIGLHILLACSQATVACSMQL